MIPNQWYAIAESKHVRKSHTLAVTRLGERMVLWRMADGTLVCMEDRCAHRGTALSLGTVGGNEIACVYHGFRYNAEGQCVGMPCAGENAHIPRSFRVKSFRVVEQYGFIFVWWGEEREHYPEIPWIKEFPPDPAPCKTRSEIWPFNYARLIENNLDAHHWAFLHGSIMLGIGARLDDYQMVVTDDSIRAWGILRRSAMAKSSETPATWDSPHTGPGWWFRLAFRMPNVNLIQVTPRFRSIVFTTPVDEFTSWVAIRVYQRYTQLPLFRQMLNSYCIRFLYAVPQYVQDFPIFHSQRPRRTGVGVSRLVDADKAIAAYLQMRERAIKDAAGSGGSQTVSDRDPKAETLVSAPGLRKTGTWNWHIGGINGSGASEFFPENRMEPFPCLMPPQMRNVRRGAEPLWQQGLIWAKNCAAFPLFLPSLIISKIVYAKDLRAGQRARDARSV
jgi:phenylpropionate dioxygenase-like ring-hydroxylating dioxygenase large terminal subunit